MNVKYEYEIIIQQFKLQNNEPTTIQWNYAKGKGPLMGNKLTLIQYDIIDLG